MTIGLRRATSLVLVLFGAFSAYPATDVYAETLKDAACVVFDGDSTCRTVSIVDEGNCVIKVHPNPIPDLEPAVAGCLIDDIDTKQVFLKKAQLSVGNIGMSKANSTVRVTGRNAVKVLTRHDENGAPVWEWRNAETFKLSGDVAKTTRALVQLNHSLCRQSVAIRGPLSIIETQTERDELSSDTMSVEEAYREAAEGRMLLVDVRHEVEWQKTGIGENAVPISIHQPPQDFLAHLHREMVSESERSIGLICASGVRSSVVQKVLQDQGFSQVYDIHEGMLGDNGWINSELPVRPYSP